MSAPYTSPPPYTEAVNSPKYNEYDNPGYNARNDPMSRAMVATFGRLTVMRCEKIYTESTAHNDSSVENGSSTFGNSFSEKAIRWTLIKKVYMILLAQMCVTLAMIVIFITVPGISDWIKENISIYNIFGVLVMAFMMIGCIPSVLNMVCFSIFIIATSLMLASISSFFATDIVLIAIGVTAVFCLSISLFAMKTRIDFTLISRLVLILIIIMLMFSLVIITIIPILIIVYRGFLALIFVWCLVFDTQVLMGGKKIELISKKYIFGAVKLHMDMIYLFITILTFLQYSK